MVSNIEVSPELIRLTQQRANRFNLPYQKQVARCVAEQAILELDPEFNFLVDSENSLAEVDELVRALKVNDIVINGRHLDVSLFEDGEVSMANALIDTPYLECGSLVVRLDGATTGSIVGYIDPAAWSGIARSANGADLITLPFSPVPNFDLADCLARIEKTVSPNLDKPVEGLAKAEDYLQFCRDRRNMSIEKQRGVVASAVSSSAVRKNIGHLSAVNAGSAGGIGACSDAGGRRSAGAGIGSASGSGSASASGGGAGGAVGISSTGSKDVTGKVLRDSAVWEIRALNVLEKVQRRFPEIPTSKLEESIRVAGAQNGGQPQAPAFKRSLMKMIARQQMLAKLASAASFSPEARAVMESFIDKVAAGKGKVEAIREYVKNQAAVDVARVIGEKRDALNRFASASADELGLAYQQLALQPAYATHSAADSTGLEAINEALNLFETARLVEEFMEIEL
jgi:hypothetical protein